MDGTTLISMHQCFEQIPHDDHRTKISPRQFIISLICSFFLDAKKRTLSSLRRNIIESTGISISRGTFWERVSTLKMSVTLNYIVNSLICAMGNKIHEFDGIKKIIGISDIVLVDSSTIHLPKKAKEIFPAPRNNSSPAAVKWHICMSLFTGIIPWFKITEAKSHDNNSFPPLNIFKGKLVIFDLGYYNFSLFYSFIQSKIYFLSRVKTNASFKIIHVNSGFPDKYIGKRFLDKELKSQHEDVVDLVCELKIPEGSSFKSRVIGFWNNSQKIYHWYVTNLECEAKLIYPLYRLRWQVELTFKAVKRSFQLSDISSANTQIIKNFILMTMIAYLTTIPMVKDFSIQKKLKPLILSAVTIQRIALFSMHIIKELRNYILDGGQQLMKELEIKMNLFFKELFEPNYRKRETSLQRIVRMTSLETS